MELRRAILLFAIVLGLAAIAASFSRPPEEDEPAPEPPRTTQPEPSATARPGGGPPTEIGFEADVRAETRTVPTGKAVIVTVVAYEPGEVRIGDLGLIEPADALTPARFDVLFDRPDRHPVWFTPTETGEERKVGVLKVEDPAPPG